MQTDLDKWGWGRGLGQEKILEKDKKYIITEKHKNSFMSPKVDIYYCRQLSTVGLINDNKC